jgi:hypothetical protein
MKRTRVPTQGWPKTEERSKKPRTALEEVKVIFTIEDYCQEEWTEKIEPFLARFVESSLLIRSIRRLTGTDDEEETSPQFRIHAEWQDDGRLLQLTSRLSCQQLNDGAVLQAFIAVLQNRAASIIDSLTGQQQIEILALASFYGLKVEY